MVTEMMYIYKTETLYCIIVKTFIFSLDIAICQIPTQVLSFVLTHSICYACKTTQQDICYRYD